MRTQVTTTLGGRERRKEGQAEGRNAKYYDSLRFSNGKGGGLKRLRYVYMGGVRVDVNEIEVFVKIQKKKLGGGEVGWGVGLGGQSILKSQIICYFKMLIVKNI